MIEANADISESQSRTLQEQKKQNENLTSPRREDVKVGMGMGNVVLGINYMISLNFNYINNSNI